MKKLLFLILLMACAKEEKETVVYEVHTQIKTEYSAGDKIAYKLMFDVWNLTADTLIPKKVYVSAYGSIGELKKKNYATREYDRKIKPFDSLRLSINLSDSVNADPEKDIFLVTKIDYLKF